MNSHTNFKMILNDKIRSHGSDAAGGNQVYVSILKPEWLVNHLSWTSETKLYSADKAGSKIYKNAVDPFSCLTETSTSSIETADTGQSLELVA